MAKIRRLSSSVTQNDKAETSASVTLPKCSTAALRSLYQAVQNLINDQRDSLGSPDSDSFHTILDKVETLHQLVETPSEQVVDGQVLLNITNALVACIKAHMNDGITPADFVNSLLIEFGKDDVLRSSTQGARDSLQWKSIGIGASHIFRRFPGCSTMIGPLNVEPKRRKPFVRKHHLSTKPSKPKQVYGNSGEERADTDINMATMFNILRKKRRVTLENLILNRSSFAQTVENLFALSFLVKDGRAEIIVDKNGCHRVSPRNAADARAVASREAVYRHFVFRFDHQDWKLMISAVEIGEELMPNRIQMKPVL